MLETEEVDVDYFTPAGSTSLANIFGKGASAEDTNDNPTLKYVPPPPPEKCKPEESKPTQWIFTCAVHGFEWSSSGYISRGKLGLAILEVVKTNTHSIILYDSNKTTVSYVTISSKLNIHKRDLLTISYYDNAQKYWSIQTSDDDMNKMLQLLKNLHATILHKSFQETDREQSDSNKIRSKDDVTIKHETHEAEHEIDTDFDMNQKTKDSILKRMANMGHSVLPSHGVSKGHTSDSTDSNENDDGKKNIRHKPPKSVPKKAVDSQDNEGNVTCPSRKVSHKSYNDGQLLKSNTSAPYGVDMGGFICEQRSSNSELRMNVMRMSDKVDVVLERLNEVINIDKNNAFSIFQNDIVQKLIKEYESKIKNYEDVMRSQGIDFHTMKTSEKTHVSDNSDNGIVAYENNHQIITKMENDLKLLREQNVKLIENQEARINELVKETETLREKLTLKNQDIDVTKNNFENDNSSNRENIDIENKVKKIMNDTYQAISLNFDDKDTYSGATITAIIAMVIKKTTVQALQEL